MSGLEDRGSGHAFGAYPTMSRRHVLRVLAGAGATLVLGPSPTAARLRSPWTGHPEPRPGIDASRVLPADAVAPHAAELFDRVREIPHIVDGIGCHCGCGDLPEMVSLLSCYEGMGMAQYCDICSGEGRLAHELHQAGHTLDEIRAAVDRRYG